MVRQYLFGVTISTHILTKRMTCVHDFLNQLIYFNSHPHEEDDRNTLYFIMARKYFNSHPHEEDDRNRSRAAVQKRYFNSHPHEEDDQCLAVYHHREVISTHILTKRMTITAGVNLIFQLAFQLTSSRRG